MNSRSVFRFFVPTVLFAAAVGAPVRAQSTGSTFGEVIALGGTPSDILLDELRGRIYLVNDKTNRIDVYGIPEKALVGVIQVGATPLAAAMSPDSAYLYVTNNGSSSISVVDLGTNSVLQTVSLPARPEGVEVGADGRALVSTVGTGTGNLQNTLLIFDRTKDQSQQLIPVQVPPPPSSPSGIPPAQLTRPITTFRSKLIRTPDGQFIVGLTNPSATTTYLFVYEVASGVILRSRTVTGQSTTLSMSPDGARFMAGFTMYDTATLAVVAQQSNANAPFLFNVNFNVQQNIGGSGFSPDGKTLFSAFNVAPFAMPATRPQASTLLISDSRNLAIGLGIKLPESIVARMVVSSDGANAWGLSESGLIYLPMSTLYDYPILQPETTQIFLAQDECNRGIASGTLKVNNLGKGKLTYSVSIQNSQGSTPGSSLIAQMTSGVAPSSIVFTMEPGRSGIVRQAGTNLATGGGSSLQGTPVSVALSSIEAINLPNSIRVYMNYRNPDQRGMIYPVPTGPNNFVAEGLHDIVVDEARKLVYITNSGYNRVELFDIRKQRFVEPIPVGQLPHSLALGLDGDTLYVANTGGESISIVDLTLRRVVSQVDFPPIPRQGNANPIFPRAMAASLFGLQFIMSNGTQWKLVGTQATVRPVNSVTPLALPAPQMMLASPGGGYILTLAGNGFGYLYDGTADTYTAGRLLFTNPITSYYGPLGAAGDGGYFLANGLILNNSMTVVGGAERPGAIQFGPPPAPGQPPIVTVVSAGQRNVASVHPLDENQFARVTTPVRQNITSVTRDDPRATLEVIDIRNGSSAVIGAVPENPNTSVFGNQRANIPPRQLVIDSAGTAYAITLSGLSVVPLATSPPRPLIAAGARGIVNASDGSTNIRPGSFITISGTNLAAPATAELLPPPTVLGGSCVTFSDISVPLLQTSAGVIQAQVPDNIRPGINIVQVRSLAMAQASDPVQITVQRPASGLSSASNEQ